MKINLYEKIFFRSCDFFRGRATINRLNLLRESQYWPLEKLRAWQIERLNTLLLKAKTFSPFYRKRLSNLDLPLKDISELQKLPMLTKEDVRKNIEGIRSVNEQKRFFIPAKTGGSTGEPTHFFRDKRGIDWNRASVYRCAEWAGLNLGERWAQMTGSHYDYTYYNQLYFKILFFLLRHIDLPIAFVNDEIYEKYFRLILKYKPTSIWGYASGIYNFALFIEKNHQHQKERLDFIEALITSSETLQQYQREKINQVFGAKKVFDHYGCREGFYIASECRAHNGYHINSEVVIVEIIDKNGKHRLPGELGRMLITDLFNFTFPFIRYEIGDVAVMDEYKPCSCGVTLPKISRIEGRITDTIILRDRILTSPNFTIFISDYKGIDQYQIIQKSFDLIEVKIIKNNDFTKENENYILSSFRKLVGEKVIVKLNYVNEIEIPKSGKRRYIISEVARDML